MTSFFARPGGARLGYVVLGGENAEPGSVPLIMINGMSMRFQDWDVISKPLSKNRSVLLFDHRDIGASIVPPRSNNEELSVALMAADAIALVESLGWKKVDMLGFSMGGSILQQILVTPSLPFSIDHAILAATTTKAPHADPEFVQLVMPGSPQPNSSPEQRKQQALAIAWKMTELGHDPEWLSVPRNHAAVEAKLPDMIVGRPAAVIAQQALTVRGVDHRPNLYLVPTSIKVLVIHGTLDRMISYSESDYILKGIPHATRVTVGRENGQVPTENYGHAWFDYFAPKVWTDVIEGFLDDREQTVVQETQTTKTQTQTLFASGVKANL